MEHATEEALKKYLKEHPNADPRNHTVARGGGGGSGGDESKLSDQQKELLEEYIPTDPTDPIRTKGKDVFEKIDRHLGKGGAEAAMPKLHAFIGGGKDLRKKIIEAESLEDRKKVVEDYFDAMSSEVSRAADEDRKEGGRYKEEIRGLSRAVLNHQDYIMDTLDQFSS
jgi:hypothetical protein